MSGANHHTQGVPFFSGATTMRRDWPVLEPRIREIAASGRFTSGVWAERLEQELCEYTGAKHVIVVGNGTDALIMMLRAAGIRPGDEVIVPAYSFFATASSVLHAGATPVMVDVLPGSYALDPDQVEAAITGRTRAILAVHLFSQLAPMVELAEVAERHGLLLLEDGAEGIGMWQGGVHAGLFGTAGALSFFPTKTLGALGDAGAVLTDDDEVAARVRRLRRHGQTTDDGHEYQDLGYNSRCDEIEAAVLVTRLAHLDDDVERRRVLAQRYTQRLAEVVETPYLAPAKGDGGLTFSVYLIETDRRDELAEFLAGYGVGTKVYYPRPVPREPALAHLARHPVPVAEAAATRALALPLYPDLAAEQVDHVADLVRDCHDPRRAR
ncbi:DegT/DnrJ/EryC1/StrS family aminotransferase [Actinophytocola sp. NPDC049390]|uniref:DegT/DnrJ/EryC1/StrS family aminotransferase n=1 Tax=Actinophytocola sp. NPDC049390 TaxID=3363894 RepID=UPI0037A61505